MKINISHSKQVILESWLFATLAGEVTYFTPKFYDLMDGKHVVINWAIVGFVALGSFLAPAFRKLVAKYPALSPFANKIVTVVDAKAGIPAPAVSVTVSGAVDPAKVAAVIASTTSTPTP